jgi:DNA modification methylase
MISALAWTTEKRRINDLVPYQKNPRTLSSKQLADLKKSLERFNLVEIPAIDQTNRIIAGHQRLKALQLLGRGEEEIDVRVPNRILSEDEYRQYLITSNAVTGDWDYELLQDFDVDFLLDLGFDETDLAQGWDKLKIDIEDNFDDEKELKKIKSTDIKRGDLLLLGKHKLLCADSTDPQAVQKLFGDERTSMIYSDPPYNIGLDYDKGVGNKANYGGSVDDNKSVDAYKLFIRQTLEAALTASTKDTHVFYWCDEAWVWVFQSLYNELGIKNRRLNIWLKNNASPTPTVAFSKVIELCVYGTLGSPYLAPYENSTTEVMNAELGSGNTLLDEVNNLWSAKRLNAKDYEHATSKPPALHEKAIRRCTKPNDIILDSFSGSGSTLICAETLKRRVYSLEMEPIFCELVKRRYEKLTGKEVKIIKGYYEKT